MANYKEEEVTLKKWERAYQISITNELNKVPILTFFLETAGQIGNEDPFKLVDGTYNSTLSASFNNPEVQYNLLNPENNEVIGTATYVDLQVHLYSLFIKLAAERDASLAAQ